VFSPLRFSGLDPVSRVSRRESEFRITEDFSMMKPNRWKMDCIVFLIFAATALAAQAQTFTNLAEFNLDNGANPQFVSLVQGVDGGFYGTTQNGGNSAGTENCSNYNGGCGVVFKVTPTGTLTALYSFCAGNNSSCFDGAYPESGLALASNGDLYGTTSELGSHGGGTVFKITPGGALTTLYSFCTPHCGGAPARPQAPLIQGSDGNFYGATPYGGHVNCNDDSVGCGTLFQMTPQGAVTKVYRFCAKSNCPDGYIPYAGLVQGADGNFYGTTSEGGTNGDGTIYKVTPRGRLTTLYNFCSQPSCSDGGSPYGGLIQATDGNFYGATAFGGNSNCSGSGCGTIFKITSTGTFATFYTFCSQPNCADGSTPTAGLIQATDGNLYGATAAGGADLIDCRWDSATDGCGTIFQITLGGTLTTLHSFSNTDGANPEGGLLQATNGTLYGTTNQGGLQCIYGGSPCGTIFSVDMGLGPFVAFVRNPAKVGQAFGILGQGFTGTTGVSLNGTPASFTVVSDTFIKATVPAGATTGDVTVITPSGTLTSNVPFHVIR
jgi:uncharacterized repeat protein (TIGR03803 family)